MAILACRNDGQTWGLAVGTNSLKAIVEFDEAACQTPSAPENFRC